MIQPRSEDARVADGGSRVGEEEVSGRESRESRWSLPPEEAARPPPAPAAATAAPALGGAPLAPSSTSAPAAPAPQKPPAFEDHAARMGRELVRVSPAFRAAGAIVLAGALILALQNAMIVFGTQGLAAGAGPGLGTPGNASSANQTFSGITNASRAFGELGFATQFDIAGFLLLGVGAILFGAASRGIEIRIRSNDEIRKPSKAALVLGVSSGIFCILWVVFTLTWRSALTGSPTGDWSGLVRSFDSSGYTGPGALPPGIQHFVEVFPVVSITWILAALMIIPAAVCFFLAGRSLRKSTGIKVGGVAWVSFSVTSFVGTLVFVSALISLIGIVTAFSGDSGGGQGGPDFGSAFILLAVGGGAKLVVVPLWAVAAFSLLAVSGGRIWRFKAGRIALADADRRAIVSTPSLQMGGTAPPAAAEAAQHQPGAVTAAPPALVPGEVVVSIPQLVGKPSSSSAGAEVKAAESVPAAPAETPPSSEPAPAPAEEKKHVTSSSAEGEAAPGEAGAQASEPAAPAPAERPAQKTGWRGRRGSS